jgi:hypothetical protein
MNKNTTNRRIGRPPSGKKSSKPGITISDSLQEEAKIAAENRGMGYSEFVAMALNRQIAIDDAKRESLGVVEFESVPDRKRKAK